MAHAASERKGTPPPRKRRLKTFIPASMRYADHDVRVHMLDISPTGAKLHATITPGSRERVSIVWRGITMPGIVVWALGSRFGMLFDQPLSGEQIAAMLD